MRLVSLSGICLASLVASAAMFSACGSSDEKRRPMLEYPSGGEGGDGASGAVAGSAGTGASSGNAGGAGGDATSVEMAGTGGVPAAGGVGGADTTEPMGGAGGEPAVAFKGLYISPTGDDAKGGGETEPFATLAHAASVAQAGDTIVFLDGDYDVAGPTLIPGGVNVMAKHSGAVTLTALGTVPVLFNIKGDTRIEGLQFSGYQTVASFAGATVNDAPGTLSIVDSSFTSCSFTCLDLSNGAKAVVTSAVDAVLNNSSSGFATLTGKAELTVDGGIIQNSNNGHTFGVTDSTLNVTGLKVLAGTANTIFHLRGTTVALLDDVNVAAKTPGNLIDIAEKVDFTAKNCDFSTQPKSAANCVVMTMDGTGSIVLEDTKLHLCGNGFKGAVPKTLTLLRTEVYDVDYGMDLVTGGPAKGGTVRITDSKVHDFKNWGFRLGDASSLMDFKMRGTQITVPAAAVNDGLIINGSNGSNYDLGTAASPGGNTILGATVNVTGLRIGLAAVTVQAVGNTWTPNVEGADALGKYSAGTATAGDKLDINAAVASGVNYIKPNALTTLRLAENP